MKVEDIMTPKILAVDADSPITEAAQKMKQFDVGVLAVMSAGSIVGLITDRDIVIRGLTEGQNFAAIKVGQIMTPNVVVCRTDSGLEEDAELFSTHRIRRLLVVDEMGDAVGIVSLGDLAIEMEDIELIKGLLQHISGAGKDEKYMKRQSAQEATEQTPVSH